MLLLDYLERRVWRAVPADRARACLILMRALLFACRRGELRPAELAGRLERSFPAFPCAACDGWTLAVRELARELQRGPAAAGEVLRELEVLLEEQEAALPASRPVAATGVLRAFPGRRG